MCGLIGNRRGTMGMRTWAMGLLLAVLACLPAQAGENFAWARNTSSGNGEFARGVAVDGAGNILVMGEFSGTVTFGAAGPLTAAGNDIYVAKMDRLGNYMWVRQIGGTGNDLCYAPNCIATGPGGTVYVTGRFDSTNLSIAGSSTIAATGTVDIFIAQLDSTGAFQWVNHPTSQAGQASRGKGIAVDGSGDCYVVGHFSGQTSFPTLPTATVLTSAGGQDIFVCKVDSSGISQWAAKCGGTGNEDGFGIGLAAGGGTDPFICGLSPSNNVSFPPLGGTPSTAGGNDVLLAKLNGTTGAFIYGVLAGGTGADQANGICVNAAGTAFITGSFTGTATFAPLAGIPATGTGTDIFVAAADGTGTFLSVQKAGANNQDDNGRAIALTGANLYVTGNFTATAAFGATNLTDASGGMFIGKFDPAGNAWLLADQGSSTAADIGESVAVDASGFAICSGEFSGNITFTGLPVLNNAGAQDTFVSKFGALVKGVSVLQTGANTAVTEGGATDTYFVALNAPPTANVTITPTPDAFTTVSAALTFTTVNWSIPQVITVTAFNDAIAQGVHASTITHAATSADAGYNGTGVASVVASVTDNDTAGVTIVQSGGTTNVTEVGATDTYTIVLTSQPNGGTVTVTPSANAVTGVTTSGAVTFTTGNWNIAQTITVTAVNDDVAEGAHTDSITHAVSATVDVTYPGITPASVTANITDNDSAGVTISKASVNVTEGGATDTYTIVLTSQPTAGTVTVTPSSTGLVGVTTSGAVTFTTLNWNTPQTNTVTATDDGYGEGAHTDTITHAVSATVDVTYPGITPASVTANITDNDPATVKLTAGTLTLDEAAIATTRSFTVELDSSPLVAQSVVIDLASDTVQGVTLSTNQVSFTSADWNTPQSVTVTVVNDTVNETNPHNSNVTLTVNAGLTTANAFDGAVVPAQTYSIADNDPVGVTVTPGTLTLDEAAVGTTRTFTVQPDSQPAAGQVILIDLGSNIVTGVTLSTNQLTFTNANWNTAQTVTVTVVNDLVAESNPHNANITFTVNNGLTTANEYDSFAIADITYSVTDNDSAGVTIVESGGSTDVNEAGATSDSFTMVLTSQPTVNVVINFTTNTTDGVTASAPLTFTNGNWNVAQTVTITAVDDSTIEPNPHTDTVAFTLSGDLAYASMAVPSVTANISDNDAPTIVLTLTGGTNAVNETGPTTDTIDVKLGSQPTVADGTVTITFSCASPGRVTFTPPSYNFVRTGGDWNTNKTVTITAVDDPIAQGTQAYVITATATSSTAPPPGYNGASSTSSVTVTDNDTAGIVITGTATVTENSPLPSTVQVRLNSQPTANVTVTPTSTDTVTGVTVLTGALTFTPVNWNVNQNVTVFAVNDAIDEGVSQIVNVNLTPTSLGDGVYNALSPSVLAVTVNDDDVAGFTLGNSGLELDEANVAATQQFRVRLDSQPAAGQVVVIDLTSNTTTGVTLSTNTLTFDDTNWSINQFVTVTAVNDDRDEANPHARQVTRTVNAAATTANEYDALGIPDITYDIRDNDRARVEFTGPSTDFDVAVNCSFNGSVGQTHATAVDKFGNMYMAGWFNLTLTIGATTLTAPTGVDCYVAKFNPDGTLAWAQRYSGPGAERILSLAVDTAGNLYCTGQYNNTVDFTGVGPTTALGDFDCFVGKIDPATGNFVWLNSAGVVSGDAIGWGLAADDNSVYVCGEFELTTTFPGFGAVASAGSSEAFVGRINTTTGLYDWVRQIGGTSSDVANGVAVDNAGMVFVTGQYTNAGTVLAGPFTLPATAGSAAFFAMLDANGNFADAYGFSSSNYSTGTAVSVDNNNRVTVVGQFSTDVNVGGFGLGALSNGSFVGQYSSNGFGFNWAQSIDSTSSCQIMRVATTPAGDNYLCGSYNNDLSIPGIGTYVIAGQNYFVMKCDSGGFFSPPVQGNASTPLADDIALDGTGSLVFVGDYNGSLTFGPLGTLTNAVNGPFLARLSPAMFTDEAGTTSTFDVVLTSQPVFNVTVTLVSDGQQTFNINPLTFTPGTWNVPQTVTVTAANDLVAETSPHLGRITCTAASADADYNLLGGGHVGNQISDNDSPGISTTPSGGTTDVTEGGATDAYDVVLISQPTADVTVTITADAQSTVDKPTLTFTSANWNVAQTVTVTAVDDPSIETTPHASLITQVATSADVFYNGIAVASVNVNITDNDVAGVTVTESGTTDVTEGGVTDTYDLVLTAQPTANVRVNIFPDTQVTASSASVIFTPATWNVPRTVTITAVDDVVDEVTTHPGVTTHTTTSGDANFAGLVVASVTANITDNDVAGITVTQTGASTDIAEGGTVDSFSVVLNTQPTANVTVSVGTDSQSTPSSGTVTFTPLDWNTPQSVSITAVDDAVAEGTHTSTITLGNSSPDGFYNAAGIIQVDLVTTTTITASVTDNDAAGILVTSTGGSNDITEGAATDIYTVRLNSQPTSNVDVSISPDSQSTTSTALLTFTTVNWNIPQNVTVTAVDDFIDEGLHTSTITHAATSFDGNYNGMAGPNAVFAITDNDFANVVITESGSSTDVVEGGATDTYDVVLATQPTATITITLTPDSQVTVDQPTLTFDNTNWNVPQTVTVTAVDDLVAEGPHTGQVAHGAASSDLKYNGLSINKVGVNITDNDAAGIAVTQSALSTDVVEGGATDTFDVVLNTMPTANVTVTLTPDAQTTVSPGTLTFTPGNYTTPQTVTVTAVLELPTIVVGAASPPEALVHPGDITLSCASSDGFYNVPSVFLIDGAANSILTAQVTDKSIQVISPGYGQSATIDVTPGSLARVAGVVTVTTTLPHLVTVGQVFSITGATDASFDGTYSVVSVTSATQFTFAQPSLADATSDSGTVATSAPETWNAGSTHAINWVSTSAVANVVIQFSLSGTFLDTVTVGTFAANSNPQSFTVPNLAAANAAVRVVDAIDATIYGQSSPFTIVIPSLLVAAPNGGETFNMGDITTVSWSSIGNIPTVDIEVSNEKAVAIATNGLVRLANIVTVTTTGNHGFSVSDRVIIAGAANTSFNGSFIITSTTPNTFTYSQTAADTVTTGGSALVLIWKPVPGLTGIANVGSATWTVETPGTAISTATRSTNLVTITTATATNIQVGDSVLIKNTLDASFSGTQTVTAVISPTQFSFLQAGPNAATTGGTVHESSQTVRVRVVDPTQTSLFDASDADFSVFNPGIFITTPNGGETINRNSNFLVQWLSVPNNASIPLVDIEVSIDGGATWSSFAQDNTGTDANGIPNNGSFLWNVTQAATQNAKIRVRNNSGGLGLGISVSPFTILGVFNLDQTLITLDPVVKSSGFDPDLTPIKTFTLTTEEDWAIVNIDPLTSQFSDFPWLQVRETDASHPFYGAAPGQGTVGISHSLYVPNGTPEYVLGDIEPTLNGGADRTSNVVTITTVSAHGLTLGERVSIRDVNDVSFNSVGNTTFVVTSVPTSTTFTYNQTGPNASSEAGTVAIFPHGTIVGQQAITFQLAMDPGNLPEGDYVGLVRLRGLNTNSERLVVVRATVTDAFRVHVPIINKDLISSDFQGTVKYEMLQNFRGTLPDFQAIVQNLSKIDAVTFSTNATTNTIGRNWLLVDSGGSGWVTALPTNQTAYPVPINILSANGAVRLGGSVTITTPATHGFTAGDSVTIAGVTDTSFDGTFTITAVAATSFSYVQAGPDANSGGGTANIGSDRVTTMIRINRAQLPSAPGVYTGQVLFSSITGETRVINVVVTIKSTKAKGKKAACAISADDASNRAATLFAYGLLLMLLGLMAWRSRRAATLA